MFGATRFCGFLQKAISGAELCSPRGAFCHLCLACCAFVIHHFTEPRLFGADMSLGALRNIG